MCRAHIIATMASRNHVSIDPGHIVRLLEKFSYNNELLDNEIDDIDIIMSNDNNNSE